MSDIFGLIEYVRPVEPTSPCGVALARFLDTPGCDILAVVTQGQPVGVVTRGSIRPQMAALPVSDIMTPALMVAEQATLDEACALLLGRPEPAAGLVVVGQGRYRGVVSMRAILRRRRGDDDSAAAMHRRFVEMLNHELRTPMNGVVAVADLLQRQPLTSDAKAFVRTIIESSHGTLRTLNDALELSRAEAGELRVDLRPVTLRELMDGVQTAWQARAERDGVRLLVGYDGPPDLAAMIDPARVQQVFDVLVEAALSLNRRGAIEVGLAAELVRDGVMLAGRVCDTGGGLSSEAVAKAFAAGFDGPDADLQAKLSLSLCRRLVERMGGEIRCEPNPGAGVTITFSLSARAVAAAQPANESRVLRRPAHVLVVDDNATNRMVAEAFCEMFECTCECVEDGLQAVEAARGGRFDLILMDIRMPRMDGLEATRAIRALGGAAGAVPIIALTANADPEDAQSYVASGMHCVVEKPIKPEKLLLAMNTALPEAGGRAAA